MPEEPKLTCEGCIHSTADVHELVEVCFHCKRAYKPESSLHDKFNDLYIKKED